jgi:hypothetical protein
MLRLLHNERLIMFKLNCFVCDVELSIAYDVVAADPMREDYLCNECEDNAEMGRFGWVGGYDYDDYALASAGWGSDEDY